MGLPAVFVRTAGCNRTCSWCDTGYTKSPSAFKSGLPSLKMSHEEVIGCIKDFNLDRRHVVFTGGEPMIHFNAIQHIANEIRPSCPWGISIETNGELIFSKCQVSDNPHIEFVISPKMLSSGQRSVINSDVAALPNAFFKFVVGSDADMIEAENLIRHIKFHNPIYLQAVHESNEGLQAILNSNLICSGDSQLSNKRAIEELPVQKVVFSAQVHKFLGLP